MKPLVLTLLTVLLCLLTSGTTARAESMQAANEAYARGDWPAAAEGYERIARSGILHEDLYYNLGNAHFRAGHYGKAIFGYEQALRIAPDHEDAAYNLRLARQVVSTRSSNQLRDAERLPWWLRFSLYASISQSTVMLLLVNALLFVALAARRYFSPGFRRSILTVLSGFLGLGVVLAGLMLAGHIHANENIHHGIVTGDLVVMREGPDATLEERGQLHPGLRVTIIASEPDWLLVRLGNGVEGWVPREEIGRFR